MSQAAVEGSAAAAKAEAEPQHAMTGGPLTGIKVLEFGQLLAGPWVSTLLGDFGATVVKVEAPQGDPMRDWGRLRHEGHSLWYSLVGRNKESITLNLREPRGQELALALCREADVIVENFRPGTMERWGLGPGEVHAINPGCVYTRVSGYGQTGGYRDRAGFASAGEAIAGLRYVNGYPDQAPPRSGISLGDTLAAQSAFQGTLLALYARDAGDGRGQVVDASIVDACFPLLESAVLEYQTCGFVREPTGPRLPRIAPSSVYRSKDGRWVVIAANHDTLWRRLATLMGHPEYGTDERFVDHHARGENQDLLDEMIGAWAAGYTAVELDAMINDAGVVCAPVNTAKDILEDPWFRERGLLVDVEDEVHGTVSLTGVVPKLSGTPGGVRHPARWTLGADTARILGEVGVDADALAALVADGIA